MGSALYYSRINYIDVDVDYRSQAYLGPCFSNSFFFPRICDSKGFDEVYFGLPPFKDSLRTH